MRCKCGCGERPNPGNQYIKGHFVPKFDQAARVLKRKKDWHKGRKPRDVSGPNNPMYGKTGADHPGSKNVRERNGNWKGGRYIDSQGYAWVLKPEHPLANPDGYVAEHRMVAAEVVGVSYVFNKEVHHKNDNKLDNKPDNLEILTKGEHTALHNKNRGR